MGKATRKWRPSVAALPGAPKGCKHPVNSFCVHTKCAPILSVHTLGVWSALSTRVGHQPCNTWVP